MARWMATIGELDRAFECEAASFTGASGMTLQWLLSQGGEVQAWHDWTTTAEAERCTLEVTVPILERTLRRWPLSLFKRWRVKTRTVNHHATLSLAVLHDEMDAAQRAEFCESVGLL